MRAPCRTPDHDNVRANVLGMLSIFYCLTMEYDSHNIAHRMRRTPCTVIGWNPPTGIVRRVRRRLNIWRLVLWLRSIDKRG
jgi:hypothetical protein